MSLIACVQNPRNDREQFRAEIFKDITESTYILGTRKFRVQNNLGSPSPRCSWRTFPGVAYCKHNPEMQ